MNKMLWAWAILAGLLIARLGYNEIHAPDSANPEMLATLLLTGGLLIGLLGATGLLGLLGWVPHPGQKQP
jgi:hypothetical protein